MKNYYEILQVSPTAHHLVINKVYRVLAAMYHPDNQQTGDAEKYLEVSEAYEALSDVNRRKEYDAQLLGGQPSAAATELQAPVDDIPAPKDPREMRNLILQLLYEYRVANPYKPALQIPVIAAVVGMEPDGIEFSRWYLYDRGYVTMSSSGDLAITASGVDYVEAHILSKPS